MSKYERERITFYMLPGMRERTREMLTINSRSRIREFSLVMMYDALPFIRTSDIMSFHLLACLGCFPVVLLSFSECINATSGCGSKVLSGSLRCGMLSGIFRISISKLNLNIDRTLSGHIVRRAEVSCCL